ncbi:hypothetical protein A3F66_05315 [candidate division TM6 bacterium RIFCSPHIGHO2_12_FULL_32_22]|nr:MAG: hypothetical protein A3F66_05315 [candidate division TM6 bacterium RIFCSPHIGHO2_12_FULL_32_22]
MEYKLNSKPWLTEEAIQFLDKFLKEAPKTILELGSGSSTIWFAERADKLISFEHDVRWYNRVNSALPKNIDYRLFKGSYFIEIELLPDNYFDLILVDGKDRLECIKNSITKIKSGGILMLDDAQREQYQIVNEWLKDWNFFTTQQYDELKKEDFQTNWWVKP